MLADTGPLYAALDPSDQHHRRAREQIDQLAAEERDVIVLFPTLLESFTLVRQRLGFAVASRFVDEVLSGAPAVNPEPSDYLEATGRVRHYPDQLITLFDAVLGVVSERLDVPVWTYDEDFDVMAITVWR